MAYHRVSYLSTKLLGRAAAILISLSVSGECLQCYWCGPLAEQVHRSTRAPSCEESVTNVTACEPGYTHCAVVASSPPFAESRYCVKFYQDECYTLYCSTTKTYRTTCPCRGELCNGPNTQREIDAFATLAHTVKTNNNRIKKRNAISNGFIISGKYKKSMVENDAQQEISNIIDGTNDTKHENTYAMQIEEKLVTKIEILNNSNSMDENKPQDDANEESEPQNSDSTMNDMQGDQPATLVEETETEMTESGPGANEEVKTPIEMKPTTKAADNADITTSPPPVEVTMKPTETTKMEGNVYISNEIKPSVQMPTAEALQLGDSPVTTEKPMEPTVTVATDATTHMTTMESNKKMMAKPTNSTKNSSEKLQKSIFGLLTCLIINGIL